MAKKLYAFAEQTAQKLEALSRTAKPQISSSEKLRQPEQKIASRKVWLFTPKTLITAASGGIPGTNYEVGSGEAYILELNRETAVLEKLEKDDGSWDYKKVYNHHESSIPDEEGTIFFGIQDWRGNFWVADINETGETGTGTGTGTGTECINKLDGHVLDELTTDTPASAVYLLGIDADGCLKRYPSGKCKT